LYCTAEIRPQAIEQEFGVVFAEYFSRELEIMRELEGDGLVELRPDGTLAVTLPLGRVLLRTVAAVFDAYLAPDAYRVGDQHCYSANA
jgi:oxygen-independent coproporphyrinogen-3 oxidase